MIDPRITGSLIMAGGSILGSGISGGLNYLLGRQQQKREDSAVQRRVRDLRRAGLSPVLAAGNPATSTPIKIGNEDFADKALRASALAYDMEQKKESIALTKSQQALVGRQADNALLQASEIESRINQNKVKTDQLDLQNQWHKDHPFLPFGQKLSGVGLLATLLASFGGDTNNNKIKDIVKEMEERAKELEERRKKLDEEKKKWKKQDEKWYLDYLNE